MPDQKVIDAVAGVVEDHFSRNTESTVKQLCQIIDEEVARARAEGEAPGGARRSVEELVDRADAAHWCPDAVSRMIDDLVRLVEGARASALQSGMPQGLGVTEKQVAALDWMEEVATGGPWEGRCTSEPNYEIRSPSLQYAHITVDGPTSGLDSRDGKLICAMRNFLRPLLTDRARFAALLRDLAQDGPMQSYQRGWADCEADRNRRTQEMFARTASGIVAGRTRATAGLYHGDEGGMS